MSEILLKVTKDIDNLMKSLAELRNEMAEGDSLLTIQVHPILVGEEHLIEDVRKILNELEPNFDEICEVKIGAIGKLYREKTGHDVTDQKIGRVLRSLGLRARRTKVGFLARWIKGSLGDGNAA